MTHAGLPRSPKRAASARRGATRGRSGDPKGRDPSRQRAGERPWWTMGPNPRLAPICSVRGFSRGLIIAPGGARLCAGRAICMRWRCQNFRFFKFCTVRPVRPRQPLPAISGSRWFRPERCTPPRLLPPASRLPAVSLPLPLPSPHGRPRHCQPESCAVRDLAPRRAGSAGASRAARLRTAPTGSGRLP